MQAAVAMFELEGRDPSTVFLQSGGRLLDKYLAHLPRGTWIDHLDESGNPKVNKIPASSLYHFMISFAEVLRVREAVERRFSYPLSLTP
jgi:N-acylglucosamine 2-epimerase/mannose-6-phosphate isomerase